MAPNSDPNSDYVILYTARYVSGSVVGIGCAAANDECLVEAAPDPVDPGTTPDALPATGFAPNRVTTLGIQPQELTYSGTGMHLEIPSLGVDVPVVGIPQSGGGWDVTWLGSQAGYLQGTAYPTWNGNSALSAHVFNADGTPGPFVNLGSLRYGDRVIIHAWGQQYIYEVRQNALVAPDDLSVLSHEDYSWLTLLTCQGYDIDSDSYNFRRAVRAVLVQITTEP
jgi:LPXTG-site transpeptidase (sortase) family protein